MSPERGTGNMLSRISPIQLTSSKGAQNISLQTSAFSQKSLINVKFMEYHEQRAKRPSELILTKGEMHANHTPWLP
jgi:hypothetical protein